MISIIDQWVWRKGQHNTHFIRAAIYEKYLTSARFVFSRNRKSNLTLDGTCAFYSQLEFITLGFRTTEAKKISVKFKIWHTAYTHMSHPNMKTHNTTTGCQVQFRLQNTGYRKNHYGVTRVPRIWKLSNRVCKCGITSTSHKTRFYN